jgi:hypothetical protein
LVTSTTHPEAWHVSRLESALGDGDGRNEHIDLPRFQRSVVWSEKKQKALIQSLLEGYPVGSLLLFERPEATQRKVFLLVDGLQRTTSIQNYLREPLVYMTSDAVDQQRLLRLRNEARALSGKADITDEHINGRVEVWMRETRTLEQAKGFSGYKLARHLADDLAPGADEEQRSRLVEAADALVDDMRERSDIRQVALPVIVFRGAEEALPDIFERINALGTALSKYEIFAATWVNQETVIHNNEIREAVEKRYEDYVDKGFRVHGIGDDGTIGDFSLFDYLFGLGKVLAQKYPLLFGDEDDVTATESMSFTLAAIAHGLRLSEMKALPSHVYRNAEGLIDPAVFEDALLEACEFVNAVLRPFIGIRLNKAGGGQTVAHTEYQIASMVCRSLAARYVPRTWEEREGWRAQRETLRRTLPQYYLFDLLEQVWRGAGDSRLFNRTWRVAEGSEDLSPAPTYLEEIPPTEWTTTFRRYSEEQLDRVQKRRSHVRAIDKLFLRFVYSDVVSFKEEMQKTFELDHVLPVSRLVDLIDESDDGWPISHVANLALFETDLNREKTKYTIPEYLEKLVSPSTHAEYRAKAIERYLLCDVDDCAIPDGPSGDTMSKEEYAAFLAKRYAVMVGYVGRGLHIALDAMGAES